MVPINHPNANVITRVIKKATNGVASPKPNGSPHFSITAIDMPAKAIIGPMDRSNSPAIMSNAAPVAIIPSCAMIATLFFKPSALNDLPSDAIASATMIIIITMKAPISGLRTVR